MPAFGSPQFIVSAIIDACVASFVTIHAQRNGIRHPLWWATGVFLLLVIVLPAYVLHVRNVRRKRQR